MGAVDYFCPAKLNLYLAVTGRRPDGFHELVSLAAPVELGDTLRVEPASELSLTCDDPALPVDERNLVMKAAVRFRAAAQWSGGARLHLAKRVPLGAGLGGGSSDAATALLALNKLAGAPLSPQSLAEVAAEVGSDCPMFLLPGPVLMRGRGERVEPLPNSVGERLRVRRVLIFKPGFAISTPWAYQRLAALAARTRQVAIPPGYRNPATAEADVGELIQAITNGTCWSDRLFNSLEGPAFEKFLAIPVLLRELQDRFGLAPRMSGSGSACFAFLDEDSPVESLSSLITAAWGKSAFVATTRIAGGPAA